MIIKPNREIRSGVDKYVETAELKTAITELEARVKKIREWL